MSNRVWRKYYYPQNAPNFMKIAEAYNIESAYATSNEEAEMYAEKMVNSDKAFILVCKVSPDTPSV